MQQWRQKVALVTGASSGIGEAIVEVLVASGMRVGAAARRLERLSSLAERCASGDGEVLPLRVDVRKETEITSAFATLREQWGGVDVLINNAGLGHETSLVEGDSELWREMLEVNVLALAVCTREALRDMRRNDQGHVIHIASMAAHRVPEGSGMYSATKYAVRALTEGLRMELRQLDSQIRVTQVSPGFVETEFAEKYHRSESKARQAYGRFPVLQARDVANTVLHVLSQPPHVQIHDVLMRPTRQPS